VVSFKLFKLSAVVGLYWPRRGWDERLFSCVRSFKASSCGTPDGRRDPIYTLSLLGTITITYLVLPLQACRVI